MEFNALEESRTHPMLSTNEEIFSDVTQVARYLTRFTNKITFRAKDLTRP